MASPQSSAPDSAYTIPRRILITGVVAVTLAAGVLGGWIGYQYMLRKTRSALGSIRPIRENNLNYAHIFPLLVYDFGSAQPFFENHELEQRITDYVRTQYRNHTAESISVYWRDFLTTATAGVNEDMQYQPGSMLKVLIMIGYFRQAELNPAILQRSYLYSATVNKEANAVGFALPTRLVVGRSYPVFQLIREMIAQSDNGAETLLIDNVDHAILNQAYEDLNIPNPDNASGDYTISAQQYVSFLRILYNATYLNEDYSEQALAIMSQSTYKDGIAAGLPQGVVTAQKYGERVSADGSTVTGVQLHNCGIIYATSPYALCVMTKGTSEAAQASVIKDISAIVYQYVSTH